ncbi:glycosyltransferase family 39 protein [Curtobacterium sp. RHCKG23]|uniref:Glycosyltransferase family 39 protein n=1 Tax=Curtobacterium citri TaxID=3055139 RepID=A0ABT7T2X3_9MICO|nr:glycosyltransferase family 39 protein [Curtobacterium citri]MDM7883890.1 glycosyltransferase family 39 protein [Curtobacterium citri]
MATEAPVSDRPADRPVTPGTAAHHPVVHHPVVRRTERVVVAIVTAAFAIVLFTWAAVVPMYQAADERAHFDAVVHVAIGDGWPDPGDLHLLRAVDEADTAPPSATMGQLLDETGRAETDTVDQMTQHPPTYYAVAAGVLHLVDFAARTPDQALLAVRLLGALLLAPLPALAWATVRRVTRSPRAALVGAFAVVAVPELASIGASASNDAPVVLFSATTVWLATRVLTGDRRVRTSVALAVSLGVAILFKGTALPLIPFVAVALLLAGGPAVRFGARLVRTVGVLAGAAVIGAWWWLRNLLVFHTLQPSGFESIRPPKPFPAGTGPDPFRFADVSWSTIARTFWGSFGGRAQWILSPVVFETATVLALGAILVWAFRREPGLRVAVALASLPAAVLVFQTANAWGSYSATTVVGATQGRYYFPALVAFIALSAIAWRRALTTDTGRRRATVVVSALGAALGCYALVFVYGSFAERSRVRVTPAGLDVLAASSPVPVPVLVSAWCAAVLLLAVAVVLAYGRVARRPRTEDDAVERDTTPAHAHERDTTPAHAHERDTTPAPADDPVLPDSTDVRSEHAG